MIYNAETIADHIIKYHNDHKYTINNLRLQKTLYFLQAEYLKTKKIPCFMDSIEAWDFGPIIPAIYEKYSVYGSGNIPFIQYSNNAKITFDDITYMDRIIDKYMMYPMSKLVKMSYEQLAWKNAYRVNMTNIITIDSITKYFE